MEVVFFLMFLVGLAILAYLLFPRNKESEIVFEEIRDPVVLHIAVPRQNDKTPLAAEQMFASIHGILRDNKRSTDFLSFEIVSDKNTGVNFYTVVPRYLVEYIEGQIYAQYPNAEITLVEDYLDSLVPGVDPKTYKPYVSTGEIEYAKDFIFPIKTFRDFEVDPLAAITSSLTGVEHGEQVMIQILIRPVANYWQDLAKDYIEAIREGRDPTVSAGFWKSVLGVALGVVAGGLDVLFSASRTDQKKPEQKPVVRLLPGQEEELRQISEKMMSVGFEVVVRLVVKALSADRSEQLLRDVIASFKQFTTANLNSFIHSKSNKTGSAMYDEYKRRFLSVDSSDILNISEVASLYHLPNISVETPNISWSRAKKSEPPMNLPVEDATIFAETDYRGKKVPFGIKTADRPLHFYLLGKTGTGKSTVFKNMIISDILAGEGVGVIDPHGDLVDDLLNFIPGNRINDVVYLAPGDINYPIGFNLLELNDPSQRDMVADGVVEVFKKHFGDSWGPRLQYILHNAILTCLEVQGVSLLAVQRLLIDKNFRRFIVKQVKDPVLMKFWTEEFAKMETNSRLVTEAVAPIQNKVGRFLSSGTIRNIVGQIKSTIDIGEIMDTQKIFLVNLSQGMIGEESSALLGGMIVTRLQSTAMERINIPVEERKEFYLYVDEFQNYATDSFAKILSEARKYKLCLHLTHQYIDQVPDTVRTAIFGNIGTFASFVIGPNDAAIVAKQFAPVFDEEDMVAMDRHSLYMKLSIDGMISNPFSARSLDLRYQRGGNKETVLNVSRERYGRPREVVEDKIKRWTFQVYSDKGNRAVPAKSDSKSSVRPGGRPGVKSTSGSGVKSTSKSGSRPGGKSSVKSENRGQTWNNKNRGDKGGSRGGHKDLAENKEHKRSSKQPRPTGSS